VTLTHAANQNKQKKAKEDKTLHCGYEILISNYLFHICLSKTAGKFAVAGPQKACPQPLESGATATAPTSKTSAHS
jgi:hypothetical protein